MTSISKQNLGNIAYQIIGITGEASQKADKFEIDIEGRECLVSFECEGHVKVEQEASYYHSAIESTVYHVNTCVVHQLYTTEVLDITYNVNKIINII